jgi:O-antigen/teichoic acid export membrane protein
MSAVLSEGKEDEFKAFVDKTLNILFLLGVPVVFLIETFAPDLIRVFSGAGYEGSIVPLMTIAPLVLIVGLEEILIIQVMMPRKMDHRIFLNSVCGAVVGVSLNLLLVQSMKAEGAAVVWLCSEMAVLVSAAFAVFYGSWHEFPGKRLLRIILLYLPLLLLLYCLRYLPIPYSIIRVAISGGVAALYAFVISCFVIKDPVVLDLLHHLMFWKAK